MQADENSGEDFHGLSAKAPLRRSLAFTDHGLILGADMLVARMTTHRGGPAGLALEGK